MELLKAVARERLGLGEAAGGDAVFTALVLAQIIEPSTKLDSIGGAAGARPPAPVCPCQAHP